MIAIKNNYPLKQHNTFGINVMSEAFIKIESVNELEYVLSKNNLPYMVIGSGSNILFTKNFEGLIIHNCIKGIKVIEETEEWIMLEVGSGEKWHDVVATAVNNNWGGIENLALIPGTAGAAPIQNIGAYGVEIKSSCIRVIAINSEKLNMKIFSNQECNFGYRDSIFKQNKIKNQFLITSIVLRLRKKNHVVHDQYADIKEHLNNLNLKTPSIKNIYDAVISIRNQKLPNPNQIGNIGSFFKNPVVNQNTYDELNKKYHNIPGYPQKDKNIKIPAAWLIEKCGWKGYKQNNIGVHHQQALVLVNYGGGKGIDILNLSKKIQHTVLNEFGIILNTEVNIY